jgi:hypothetical protein
MSRGEGRATGPIVSLVDGKQALQPRKQADGDAQYPFPEGHGG